MLKYFVGCLFLFFSFQTSGQAISLDSLNKKFEIQQKEIFTMQNIMIKHHKMYSNGIAVQIAGLIVLSTGFIAPAYSKVTIPIGAIISIIGSVIIISSHTGFGKARKFENVTY